MDEENESPISSATPRKKSCVPCSRGKVRCDQKRPYCSRCEKRDRRDQCIYKRVAGDTVEYRKSKAAQRTSPKRDEATSPLTLRAPLDILDFRNAPPTPPQPIHASNAVHAVVAPTTASTTTTTTTAALITVQPALTFNNLDLVCTIEPQAIATRWLKQFMPPSDSPIKNYPARIINFISNILRAYASCPAVTGTLPPFVHGYQQVLASISPPLATCISLTRLCSQPLHPGSQAVILETLKREMDRLYTEHKDYREPELLAAFQAYLIYSLLIYFHFDGNRDNGLHQIMVNLEEIACTVAQGGLVSACELRRSRPAWESWIIAEAKRRTLFTMYLFDSILCARDGLPTFLGTELRSTPAPGGKLLWQANERSTWNLAYNEYLHQWGDDKQLQIEELWPAPTELSDEEVRIRDDRVAKWAVSLDEFGTMLYAVTVGTHGE